MTALIALSAALRLGWITSTSLWFDEVFSLVIARAGLKETLPLALVVDANSLLFSLILHFWIRIAGESLLALRLLPFIFGLAALIIYGRWCWIERKEKALLPVSMGCFSYFWIYHGTELRAYSLFLLLGILSHLCFLKILRSEALLSKGWSLFAVNLMGLYTHLYFLFIVVGQCLWLWKKKKPLLAFNVGALLFFLPWLFFCLQRRAQYGSEIYPLSLQNFLTTLGTLWVGKNLLEMVGPLWISGAGALFFIFCLWGGWTAFKNSDELGTYAAGLSLFTVLAAIFSGILVGQSHLTGRYLMGVSPLLFFLPGIGLSAMPKRTQIFGKFLIGLVLICGAGSQIALKSAVDPDFAGKTARIAQIAPPDALIVHTAPYWYVSLNYYYCPGYAHALFTPEDKQIFFMTDPKIPKNILIKSWDDVQLQGKRILLVDPMHRFAPKTYTFLRSAKEYQNIEKK